MPSDNISEAAMQPASNDQLNAPASPPSEKKVFPVVGIGASAGGLQALQQFFATMPPQNGMAFVVVVHLSPHHESQMASILQHTTTMPVVQVTEPIRIAPETVYIIPPAKDLIMEDGMLVLTDPSRPNGRHVAIDLFFRTLAEARTTHAACIILSGTGSDGSVGLRRMKETGGVIIVQDPREAEYDAMPRNAITTESVDFVLPVAEMPERLLAIWRTSKRIVLPSDADAPASDMSGAAEHALRDVLAIVQTQTGHDFTNYKRATIVRRIERRMQVRTLATVMAYRDYLQDHHDEATLLLKDLLIGVTNFFRDPVAFETFEREVVPLLFANKTAADTIRVWVAGCASGEEVYSVAMLLVEHASRLPHPPKLQLFATDIDATALQTAREGSYPGAIEADVSEARLRQFFTVEPGGYRISYEIRKLVTFAEHNLLRDPPFSQLDLLTCRNLLIYFNRDVQEQLFELFHFALRPNGVLFLGNSESVDEQAMLFSAIDKKQRLFRSNPVKSVSLDIPRLPLNAIHMREGGPNPSTRERRKIAFGELHQWMVERYAPPSIVITSDYDIVHLSEHAGRYLHHSGGTPSLNLLQVIVPDLRVELRPALFEAFASGKATEARRVQLLRDGQPVFINMIVRPERDPSTNAAFALVLFAEADAILGTEGTSAENGGTEPLVHHLENENQHLKAQLEQTIEQYETTVEELRSSNEELQSTNEKLRSTTEELETSREELQSVNEELHTTNQELNHRIDEVSRVNDDLKNLIASTDLAILFLDRSFRIKRFTPRALDIFKLIASDEGRELGDITHKLDYDNLLSDAESVLRTLQPIEREIRSRDDHYYLTRLVPYRTTNERIDGVVVTFVEITQRRQMEEAVRQSAERTTEILESISDAFYAVDSDFVFTYINTKAEEWWGRPRETLLGKHYWTEFPATVDSDSYRMHHLALEEQRVIHYETISPLVQGWIEVTLYPNASGGLSCYFKDIRERKRTEAALIETRETLESQVAERTQELAATNRTLEATIAVLQQTEQDRQQLIQRMVTTQEDERQRISRELHDSLGQFLAALMIRLSALDGQAESLPEVRSGLADMSRIARQIDGELDRLTMELRPPTLSDLGLAEALLTYSQEWTRTSGIPTDLLITGLEQTRLPATIETTVYRIVQEALTNVLKHAQATQVSIIIERRLKLLHVIIEDNGRGFDTETVRQERSGGRQVGLIGIAERITLVNGTLNIDSEPGSGTTLRIDIPLQQDKT